MKHGYISLLTVFGMLLSTDVSSAGPIEISTIYELQAMRDNLSGNYVLANDIDASVTADWNELVDRGAWDIGENYTRVPPAEAENGHHDRVTHDGNAYYALQDSVGIEPGIHESWDDYWQETTMDAGHKLGWEPVGCPNVPFEGSFDGGSHTIGSEEMPLCSYRPDEENVGLFGYVARLDAAQEIKNVVIHVDMSGWNGIGAIIGRAITSSDPRTHVKNCKAFGYITSESSISPARSNAKGGMIGAGARVTIENCISYTTVEAPYAAGFIGRTGGRVTLINCLAVGLLQGANKGGLSAAVYGSNAARNCFWDTETTTATTTSSGTGDGTGKTTKELHYLYTFTDLRSFGLGQEMSGTASATPGSKGGTGVGTEFMSDFEAGNMIRLDHGLDNAEIRIIETITGDTEITVTEAWEKEHTAVGVYKVAETDRWDMGVYPSRIKDYPFLSIKDPPAPTWYIYEPPHGTVIYLH